MRPIFINALFALICFTFCGCYSYRIYPKEDRKFLPPAPTRSAWIVNPELKKEFRVIRSAGIYSMAKSPEEADCKIQLHPMGRNFVCGNGVIGYAFFLGQIPLIIPDKYRFSYQEINGKDSLAKNFELEVAKRFWFWDMFVWPKRFPEKLSRSLAANYHRSRYVTKD